VAKRDCNITDHIDSKVNYLSMKSDLDPREATTVDVNAPAGRRNPAAG
jgi:hypothetical protein